MTSSYKHLLASTNKENSFFLLHLLCVYVHVCGRADVSISWQELLLSVHHVSTGDWNQLNKLISKWLYLFRRDAFCFYFLSILLLLVQDAIILTFFSVFGIDFTGFLKFSDSLNLTLISENLDVKYVHCYWNKFWFTFYWVRQRTMYPFIYM